ncbi:MAG: C25 family cysteine peptidase, partial [Verrucomicrobia bacterium]|nr:C25 family cysteine peptidase [Verrucomicrobiota bacterium]
VDGFTSSAITVLNLDNPKVPAVVNNLTIEGPTAGYYRVSFVPATPSSHCLAFQAGAGMPVNSLALAQVLGLSSPTNAADYLIITPTNFLAAATNLAVYRQQKGLRSLIVPLDPIYNEFAFGFPGPHAIQGFLATAYANWTLAPHYVVLFGDGTFDYRNLQSCNDNLVPPLMISTIYGLFCSDSIYGDVNSDGLPELAVGRLSGHTPADMQGLVNKIIQYETQPLPSPAKSLLIADTPDSAGDFNADIAAVDAILAGKFSNNLIRATDIPNPVTMQSVITNAWNQGVDLVTYSGHGAVDRFGSAGYVTIAQATNLTNTIRWPVVVATTCVSGQFSVPGSDCLAEYLMRQNAGGAIATVAPTGFSLDGEASQLNNRLAQLLRTNALPALGDSVRQAMADHIRLDAPNMPVWIYNLLGDPGLRYDVLVGDNVVIGDYVWDDSNANGVQDTGELGIAEVTLTLSGTDGAGHPVTATTTTDASGHYQFTEPPGTYTVAVTTPAGYTPTVTGKGTLATDSNPSPSGTTPGTLAS